MSTQKPQAQLPSILESFLEDMESNGSTFSGATKRIRINLAALTRVEYSEEIDVPVEFEEEQMDEFVNLAYQEVDGGLFQDDTQYWEKGNCFHEECA